MKMKLENQVIRCLEDHKCFDIKKIDVTSITPFATYYVIATVMNMRALGAIAEALEDELAKSGYAIKAKDGKPETGWIVVVVEDVTVHLFLQSMREEISLEEAVSYQTKLVTPAKA